MIDRLLRLLAAIVLVAAGSTAVAASPASAASCATASGVTVVVDFHELGGGVQQLCDAGGGGKYASTVFGESGFSLTRVQREQGFVCRVNNAPTTDQESCVNTPPADAYWGLWWSNGTSGTWTYASAGVDSQKVPAGSSVALSWNGSSTKSPPRSTPPSHAASPSPSATPKPTPSAASPSPGAHGGTPGHATDGSRGHSAAKDPSAGSASDNGTAAETRTSASSPAAGASPSPRASRAAHAAQREPTRRDHPAGKGARDQREKAQASPSLSPSGGSRPASAAQRSLVSADKSEAGGEVLPAWLAPAVLVSLFAAAGGIALVRRRRGVSGQ
jgi:hypothetical protein